MIAVRTPGWLMPARPLARFRFFSSSISIPGSGPSAPGAVDPHGVAHRSDQAGPEPGIELGL